MTTMSEDPGSLMARAIGFDPEWTSVSAGWKNVALYQWNGSVEECELQVRNEPALFLHIGGGPMSLRADAHWSKKQSYPGMLTFVPPATKLTCHLGGKVRSLAAYLNPACFDTAAELESFSILSNRLHFLCGFKDDLLSASIRSLADEMKNPNQVGSLFADSLANAVGLHLLRKCIADKDSQKCQTLSRSALRKALDLIEDSIETGISLETLSSTVGLSRAHFSKAFKNSTGMAPHSYLTNRRIARACEFLSTTHEPIVQVAIRCGFWSQAHFTEYFRRSTGMTPSNFRRSRVC
jgi:AraC family transcriptional regulator